MSFSHKILSVLEYQKPSDTEKNHMYLMYDSATRVTMTVDETTEKKVHQPTSCNITTTVLLSCFFS